MAEEVGGTSWGYTKKPVPGIIRSADSRHQLYVIVWLLCLPDIGIAARALSLACAVDHIREFLAVAVQQRAQLCQALPVLEGTATGNREEPGNLCGLTH